MGNSDKIKALASCSLLRDILPESEQLAIFTKLASYKIEMITALSSCRFLVFKLPEPKRNTIFNQLADHKEIEKIKALGSCWWLVSEFLEGEQRERIFNQLTSLNAKQIGEINDDFKNNRNITETKEKIDQ